MQINIQTLKGTISIYSQAFSPVTQAMRAGRIARLLTDSLNPKWGYKSRVFSGAGGDKSNPPQTVTFAGVQRIGKGDKVTLTSWMDKYMERVNGASAWAKIKIPAAGWINTGSNPEFLTWAGNDVIVKQTDGAWANIYCIPYNTETLAETWNTVNGRLVIHKFNAVTKDGGMIKLGNGVDAYTPLISDTPDCWIPLAYLELWPELPYALDGKTITEYELIGHETWGKTSDGGRVCLYDGSKYLTGWRLNTPMPPK